MIREQFREYFGFEFNHHGLTEEFAPKPIEYGKDGGIKTPLDKLESAMSFGKILEMGVVPSLEVALIHGFSMDLSAE